MKEGKWKTIFKGKVPKGKMWIPKGIDKKGRVVIEERELKNNDMKLKTLKDLVALTGVCIASKGQKFADIEELRQEAKKWIKCLGSLIKASDSMENSMRLNFVIEFFGHFFNIKESDLK